MPGKTRSRKRKGGRGPCSYCNKMHKKGNRRGDSCGGHTVRTLRTEPTGRPDDEDGKKKDKKAKDNTRKNTGHPRSPESRKERRRAEAQWRAENPNEEARAERAAQYA